jgi:hypothetical protein
VVGGAPVQPGFLNLVVKVADLRALFRGEQLRDLGGELVAGHQERLSSVT